MCNMTLDMIKLIFSVKWWLVCLCTVSRTRETEVWNIPEVVTGAISGFGIGPPRDLSHLMPWSLRIILNAQPPSWHAPVLGTPLQYKVPNELPLKTRHMQFALLRISYLIFGQFAPIWVFLWPIWCPFLRFSLSSYANRIRHQNSVKISGHVP